jgi:hypothetical protein
MGDPEGLGGADGTEVAGEPPSASGSYGEPGRAAPDPKRPVTSMDTADEDEAGDDV